MPAGRRGAIRNAADPKRRARHFYLMVADFDIAPEATVRELRRSELFGGLAQRKARHARLLRHIGDLLLAELPAPAAHQRVERIPVRDPVPLCRKSWIT